MQQFCRNQQKLWHLQQEECFKRWKLFEPDNFYNTIFKADPIRVDFQVVSVLKKHYRQKLENKLGHKPSPLELSQSESSFFFFIYSC
jgi:hypothetical protein